MTERRLAVNASSFLDLRTPQDVQLSPDGARLAFVVAARPAGGSRVVEQVWRTEGAGAEPQPLPVDFAASSCPRWSPDGSLLAFVARSDAEDASPQLYVLPASGGEPRQVCTHPTGVASVAWSPDGTRLAFLATTEAPETADPLIVADAAPTRLWTVHLHGGAAVPVTPEDVSIWEFAWSPTGERFGLYALPGGEQTDWYRGAVAVVQAHGGAVRTVARMPGQAGALAWSPDGRQLAYIAGDWSDPGVVGGDIYVVEVDAASPTPRNLTPNAPFSPTWVRWSPDGQTLLYAGSDGLGHQIGRASLATGERETLTRDVVLGGGAWPRLTSTADLTRLACARLDAAPPEVWSAELPARGTPFSGIQWQRRTRLNALAEETLEIVPSTRLRYPSVDGLEIEALLTLPPQRTERPPLVLHVHGGPSGAWRDEWTGGFLTQMFVAAGYAVLRPNPRGSLGRGVAFADAVLGDMGGLDLQDALRGVDEVLARGLADPDRLALAGWSYGGFLSAWGVTQTTRFRAAMVGAGITDFHSYHAQSNIPDWDVRFLRAQPLERPDVYRERSPITYAARITTPTLIVHGAEDACVPVNQAYAFYRALREANVPVELAVYPREGHAFGERAHVRDLGERVLRWFAQHL